MSDTHGPVGAPVRRFGAPMSVTRGRLGAPMSATRGSFVAPMSATHGSFVRHSWTLLSSTPERRSGMLRPPRGNSRGNSLGEPNSGCTLP